MSYTQLKKDLNSRKTYNSGKVILYGPLILPCAADRGRGPPGDEFISETALALLPRNSVELPFGLAPEVPIAIIEHPVTSYHDASLPRRRIDLRRSQCLGPHLHRRRKGHDNPILGLRVSIDEGCARPLRVIRGGAVDGVL